MRAIICLVAAFALPVALGAQQSRNGPSTGISNQGTYSLELEIISPEQIESYQQGTPASEIVLGTGETLEEFLDPKGAAPMFELAWTAVTCGGGMVASGDTQFETSCGQSVSGTSTGGGFTLEPVIDDGTIFSDDFESGDTSAWDVVVSP